MSKAALQTHDLRILPYQKEKGVYVMRGVCGNCGHRCKLLIPKGEEAPSYGLMNHPTTCPHCGVRDLTAVKS